MCFTLPKEVKDEQEIPVTFFDENGIETATTTMIWYYRNTYEHCFKLAGFNSIVWHYPWVAKDGFDLKGEAFWHNWMNPPKDIIFEVKKN